MFELGYFNFECKNDVYLLTNDMGHFVHINTEIFNSLMEHSLDNASEAYKELMDKGFIYESRDNYIATFSPHLNCMKECAFRSTQLMIIVLTDACNQRCCYCQAGEVHTSMTSIDTCKKAIDIAVQSPVGRMTIEFQGGEPSINKEALLFSVPYAKKLFEEHGKKVDFAIVSNLTNPDPDLIDWLVKENVHISTSLDGPRELHNLNRPLATNESSYDAWQRGIKLYKECGFRHGQKIQISAIQTTTRQTLAFGNQLIDEYLQNGMNNLYVRPLTPLGCAKERWDEIGYSPEEYLHFYTALIDEMIERNKNGIEVYETTAAIYLRRILYNESVGHTEFRSPCGAAIGQMAVNYDGCVYTCDEGRMVANMGDTAFQLGTVDNTYQELITSPVAHTICTSSCIEGLPFCSDCVYSPYCATCPVVNYGIEADLMSHDVHSYRCQIAKGIIGHLFSKIRENDPKTMQILYKWAEN